MLLFLGVLICPVISLLSVLYQSIVDGYIRETKPETYNGEKRRSLVNLHLLW
jgi:hypothetical protein